MKKIEIELFDSFWAAVESESKKSGIGVNDVILVAIAIWMKDHGYSAEIRKAGYQ